MDTKNLKKDFEKALKICSGKEDISLACEVDILNSISTTIVNEIMDDWNNTRDLYLTGRKAYYISAEYLMGRALGNNLVNLGIYNEVKELFSKWNIDINKIENLEQDAGLGNGGLGRLAACFMDSAATLNMPIKGYGIRYKNGLFNQKFKAGEQAEETDNWLKYGDPWSVQRVGDSVTVNFKNQVIKAVPYDTPIIGYGTKNINTLRLWQAESENELDFNLFNDQHYDEAVKEKNRAENISRVLYPNDSNDEGKLLRLKQQYFLVSASLQDIIRGYKLRHKSLEDFEDFSVVQLNDTHPVLAIPEFIRIAMDEEGLSFDKSLEMAKKIFAYTNHTILAEALEKWDIKLMNELFPRIVEIIVLINDSFIKELKNKKIGEEKIKDLEIIQDNRVFMAHLAIAVGFAVNGVAKLHTEILIERELKDWYEIYPEKFQNKTNGITPRRWIKLCNKELSEMITKLLGGENWVTDLKRLEGLKEFISDDGVIREFLNIKKIKKIQLAKYIKETQGIEIDPNSIYDIQIKRLHEYKRQLLNAFYILDLYNRLKENPDLEMESITFIFGAKAFPGYRRAKAIVKYIIAIGKMINNDESINGKIKVVFVENYNVSYGERLFPAADVSKQISMAGKEASGTGNMKFMLNGAPTFGTYDGANVEIVTEAGEENNFIFGLTVEGIEELKGSYDVKDYLENVEGLKDVVESLIDGTFEDNENGDFEDLYKSLVEEGDQYYILADFESFREKEDKLFKIYKNRLAWGRICLNNIAAAGKFSSDRTIEDYAKEIWNIKPVINK